MPIRSSSLALPVILCIAVSATLTCPIYAQTPRDSILATVQGFFDAMTAHDEAASRSLMIMDGQYHRVRQDNNHTSVQRVTFEEYVSGLSSSDVALLERMWEPTVLRHGPIAVVWTAYDFHRGGEFSHCGVDAFHLIRTDDGWKISSVVFTIERDGCAPSPLGPPGIDE